MTYPYLDDETEREPDDRLERPTIRSGVFRGRRDVPHHCSN
ncbi:uncharacterized protein G2W53_034824 [Senna tora]|uniref:Uncharacterized protein n=1 Tax=Senna tora TaxID=362788 RepID=A0A834SZX6_9FABA|nr:uncharacterized protein G2W53_034824 [Senna tora]